MGCNATTLKTTKNNFQIIVTLSVFHIAEKNRLKNKVVKNFNKKKKKKWRVSVYLNVMVIIKLPCIKILAASSLGKW